MNIMKTIKILAVTLCITLLSACGSHGYEGTYKMDTSKKGGMGSLLGGFGVSTSFTIGTDYIEAEGQRTEVDEIFVRESGGKKYLVLKTEAGEDTFTIVDDKTLLQGNAMMSFRFVRVD